MAYDLKNLTLVTSGITDGSVIFGAKDGQGDAAPDPISATAVRDYVLTGAPVFISIADDRILANISGAPALPVANTLTAVIDAILGGTRGNILYRGASSWTALAPGTAGRVLSTQGSGADPTWETGPTTTVPDPLTLNEGLRVIVDNPDFGGLPGFRRAAEIIVQTDSSTSAPNFANEDGFAITYSAVHGQNTNGARMQAKKTFVPLDIAATYHASGQKFAANFRVTSFGMGDTAAYGACTVKYSGGPVNGDEGQGFGLFSFLEQQSFLVRDQIATVTRSAITPTTITGAQVVPGTGAVVPGQFISAATISQTFGVASTAGIAVGDWLVIDQELARNDPILEAIQVEAIGVGTLTAKVFYIHHPGATVTAAMVIALNQGFAFQMGQDRILVNLSGASVTAGTAKGTPLAAPFIDGSGTSWTTDMVGGDATNVGAITFAPDDIAVAPFDAGAGPPFEANTGRLKSWFQILTVFSDIKLSLYSMSVAGDQSYRGRASSFSNYEIRPCAKILRILNSSFGAFPNVANTLVCETSTATWSVGHTIECVVCPYPDTGGYQFGVANWTPNSTNRSFMHVRNSGAQRYETAYSCDAQGPIPNFGGTGGVDTVAWGTAFRGIGCNYGLEVTDAAVAGIFLEHTPQAGGKSIIWGNGASYLTTYTEVPLSGSGGFIWKMVTHGGTAGSLKSSPEADPNNLHPRLTWDGALQVWAKPFSFLPPADAIHQGCIATVTNCSHTTPGVAADGGGSNTVLVFCTGAGGVWKVVV